MKTGEIIAVGPKYGDLGLYGIVTGFDDRIGVFIRSYSHGFPEKIYLDKLFDRPDRMFYEKPKYRHEIITKDQLLEHLVKYSLAMDSETKKEDLAAACWASRQHYLNGVIENIKNSKDLWNTAALEDVSPSKTGVYILCKANGNIPESCNVLPNLTNLEGLRIIPRINPLKAAILIAHMFPSKFGCINADNDFHPNRELMNIRYFAYEIPKNAVDFVKNPFIVKFECGKDIKI